MSNEHLIPLCQKDLSYSRRLGADLELCAVRLRIRVVQPEYVFRRSWDVEVSLLGSVVQLVANVPEDCSERSTSRRNS